VSRTRTSASDAETIAIGLEVGRSLRPGDVVLIEGPLGAGKTVFVRGLAQGLGCDPDAVSSPTFPIVQEYQGRTPLQHVDLYRLTPIEVDDLGLDDLLPGCAMAVEWPDRWRDAPRGAIKVRLEPIGGDERVITIGYSTR
jgi:tRNA threonylcarbamoyladenosine biosynthesis protein TsaE